MFFVSGTPKILLTLIVLVTVVVSVIVNVNWNIFLDKKIQLYSRQYLRLIYISFEIEGPMTYTSAEGKTTLYGVVHGQGTNEASCGISSLLIRVSAPEILRWIKLKIKEHDKL